MRLATPSALLLLVSCGGAPPPGAPVQVVEDAGLEVAPRLEVTVSGASSLDGDLCVALFGGPSGFPDDDDGATLRYCAPLASQPLIIEGLSPGATYALSVFADLNGNARLDTKKFLGLDVPAEGFGFSNDAMGTFGPPSWEQAKFVFPGGVARVALALTYY